MHNYPIEVSPESYNEIEKDLQQWYDQSHWNRMYKDGVKFSNADFIERFALVVEVVGNNEDAVDVKLVCRDNDEHIPYHSIFDRWTGLEN